MSGKLGSFGVIFKKKDLTSDQLRSINEDLTVAPKVIKGYSAPTIPFPVYKETKNHIILPKFYSIKKFGQPKKILPDNYTKIDLKFQGELRPAQTDIVKDIHKQIKKESRTLLCAATGCGKCLGIDTPVIMYDGKVKMVQDVNTEDYLMGDDSTPRKVLSLARGKEQMYKIIPNDHGTPYIVNESHILSLKNTIYNYIYKGKNYNSYQLNWFCKNTLKCKSKLYNVNIYSKEYIDKVIEELTQEHGIIDISVKDYLNLSKSSKHILKGYRVPINYPEKKVPLDPYMLGVWLGDGSSNCPMITTQDHRIILYLKDELKSLDLFLEHDVKYTYKFSKIKQKLIINKCNNCDNDIQSNTYFCTSSCNIKYRQNNFTTILRNIGILDNKHIPHSYLCNSRENRLKLLAGILDTDGYNYGQGYEITQKNKQLALDIQQLAQSLGFFCSFKKVKKHCYYKGEKREGEYYRCNIGGEHLGDIPVLIDRKKIKSNKQQKDKCKYGFKVEKLGIDNYYGFEIDGNRRFLLGDCTVTHNTVMTINIIATLKRKTIIVVHKEFLMEQWRDRIKQFLPGARIGYIQGPKCEIEDYDIVIGMIQSLSKKDYPKGTFDSFGFTIIDEVHHIGGRVFSQSLSRVNSQVMLGLSATPKRKDGLTCVLDWTFGKFIIPKVEEKRNNVTVKLIEYLPEVKVRKLYRGGGINIQNLTNQICENTTRTGKCLEVIRGQYVAGKDILVLSDRVAHVKYMCSQLISLGYSAGLYIGGMKEADRAASAEKRIIFATYQMVAEAFDVPRLNTLIMCSPKKDIVQIAGRILRKQHVNFDPLIIDFWDRVSIYESWGFQRIQFYKKRGYSFSKKFQQTKLAEPEPEIAYCFSDDDSE